MRAIPARNKSVWASRLRHHEPAVTVADYSDSLGVGHADFHRLGHRRFRVGHELRHEGVVGGLGISDHRHRGAVEHGVALEQEEEVGRAVEAAEAPGRTADLTCGGWVRVLERIGIDHRRQPRALLVAGGKHQLEAERHAVLTLVANEAFLDLAQLGRRVLEAGDGLPGDGPGGLAFGGFDLLAQGGQVIVGHVDRGLRAHHESVLATGECHEVLVAFGIAAEEALDLACLHLSVDRETAGRPGRWRRCRRSRRRLPSGAAPIDRWAEGGGQGSRARCSGHPR